MPKWAKDSLHVAPPSWLADATRPWAPPFDQRSCWKTLTMLAGFAGLTATNGSTSLFTQFVPGPPTVQPENGLRPDTFTVRGAVKPRPDASPTTASAVAAAPESRIQRERLMPYLLLGVAYRSEQYHIARRALSTPRYTGLMRKSAMRERAAARRGRAGSCPAPLKVSSRCRRRCAAPWPAPAAGSRQG